MLTAERQRELLTGADTLGHVTIEVIREGYGPSIVLLPSSMRDSEDFDDIAQMVVVVEKLKNYEH